MNKQLLDYILTLDEEGYGVSFKISDKIPLVIKIKLEKSSFAIERIFHIYEIRSYAFDADSVVIHKLSEMKAEFEQDMRLRSKMKGEDKHG